MTLANSAGLNTVLPTTSNRSTAIVPGRSGVASGAEGVVGAEGGWSKSSGGGKSGGTGSGDSGEAGSGGT